MTVSTKVTAPHSRRRTAQFTSRKFYREPGVAIRPDSFRRSPDVPPPTAARRRVWRRGFRGEAISKGHPYRALRATSVLTRALEIVVARAGAFLFLLLA